MHAVHTHYWGPAESADWLTEATVSYLGEGSQCSLQADIYGHVMATNHQGGLWNHEPWGKSHTPGRGRSSNW